MQNYLKLGSWNLICDVCGRKIKNTEARKRWDGLVVCPRDWELRHISDFIKSNVEHNNVKDPRPEQTDTYIDVTFVDTGDTICSVEGSSSYADIAVSECMTADKDIPGYF
jgi:hypothetical protein